MNKLKVLILNDFASVGATMSKIMPNVDICYPFPKNHKVFKLLITGNNPKFIDDSYLLPTIDKLKQISKDYDIMICFGWSVAKWCYLANVKYIMYINDPFTTKECRININYSKLKNMFIHKLYDNVIRGANIVVSGHKDYITSIQRYRKDDIIEIINPLDYDRFSPDGPKTNLKKEKFTFLAPTRIEKEKGTDILYQAIEKTRSNFQVLQADWHWDINKDFYQKITSNLPKKVKMIDTINYKDMPSYYRSVDGILGAIMREYPPMIEKEAIACGVPVFHHDEVGYTDNDPFYKGSKDPNEIAQYIDRIVTDDEFRKDLQEIQLAWLHKTIDNQKIVQQWETVLKDAVTRKRKKANPIYQIIFKLTSILRPIPPS